MKLHQFKLFAPTAKVTATVVVIVCAACVVANVVAAMFYAPDQTAQRELELLAQHYYEDYFYGNFLHGQTDDVAAKLEKYTENGFSPVYLRELILYDEARHPDARKYFDNNKYYCDTNSSYVVFFPQPPYSEQDYTVGYKTSCEFR